MCQRNELIGRFGRHHLFVVTVATSFVAAGADLNGYTAQYECRRGNPNCDVDLTPPPCEVTVKVSAPDWSAIRTNQTARVYCIECGDHWNKGRLWLESSGSAQARKWLRYTCANDGGNHPAAQRASEQARLYAVGFERASYWVLHRLTFEGRGQNINSAITFGGWGVDGDNAHNILDSLLFQNAEAHFLQVRSQNPDNTLQNSIARSPIVGFRREAQCVEAGGGPRFRAVNNEIYNCQKGISIGSGINSHPGLVIENNDIYATPAAYTNCQGQWDPNGKCGITEDLISLKAGGTAAEPALVRNNRLWGARTGDSKMGLALNGDGTALSVSISGLSSGPHMAYPGGDWIRFDRNLVWDCGVGFASGYPSNEHLSIVSNVFWDMAESQRDPQYPAAFDTWGGVHDSEFYFNSIVAGDNWFQARRVWPERDDVRCNLVIEALPINATLGQGTQFANNAFYGTTPFTTDGGAGDIVGAGAAEAKVGDLCFWRKLLTGPERFCIPKVVPAKDSPHVNRCEPSIGARAGLGVDDKFGTWFDALGRPRDAFPDIGAIEYVSPSDGGWIDGGQPPGGNDAGASDAGDAGGPAPVDPPTLVATRVDIPPHVDGDLREFAGAAVAQASIADQRGLQVRALWDGEALYLGSQIADPFLHSKYNQRDAPLWDDDSIELLFDTLSNREGGELPGIDDFKFFVSSANMQSDYRGGGLWEAWSANWQSSVSLKGTLNSDSDVDQGYSVEIRIPWSALGISIPAPGSKVGFDFRLNDVASTGIDHATWANTTGGTVNDPAGFGALLFDGPAPTPADGGTEDPPAASPGCGCSGHGGGGLGGAVACAVVLVAIGRRLRKARIRGALRCIEDP